MEPTHQTVQQACAMIAVLRRYLREHADTPTARVWSGPRDAVLRRDWSAGVSTGRIRAAVNALPGRRPVEARELAPRAQRLGLTRPPGYTWGRKSMAASFDAVAQWAAARGLVCDSPADLATINAKRAALSLAPFRL